MEHGSFPARRGSLGDTALDVRLIAPLFKIYQHKKKRNSGLLKAEQFKHEGTTANAARQQLRDRLTHNLARIGMAAGASAGKRNQNMMWCFGVEPAPMYSLPFSTRETSL
jgi:hypothetical protein